MEQRIITPENEYGDLDRWIGTSGIKKLFLVCGTSFGDRKDIAGHIEGLRINSGLQVFCFNDYQPNPLYENVVEGVKQFRKNACDGLMAVGGGSAIDVAKCVKLFSNMDGDGDDGDFLRQKYTERALPFLVMPTTAGTGTEATRYAVIYYKGNKQSITSDSIIPDTVLFDPDCLITLPAYQKKATMMDAFCHALESFWSVNSTEESRDYSRKAIKLILENMDGYIDNTFDGRRNMLTAANLAGKAINISQTTAGHAMCYKLTGMFGVSHGHAAILCDRALFPWMINNIDKCIDPRGKEYLERVFEEIGRMLGCNDAKEGASKLEAVFNDLELDVPRATKKQLKELGSSVNPDRMKNNPILPDEDDIDELYKRILVCEPDS